MSRHALPVSDTENVRLGNLGASVAAAAVTVTLVLPPLAGRLGLLAAIAALQLVLVHAFVVGTNVPGRVGATLLGAGTAAGCDALLYTHPHDGLSSILYVYPILFALMIAHQLARGVMRVRVTESLSKIAAMCAVVAAFSAYLVLDAITHGTTLVAISATATGLAMIAGYLVDAVLPVPRFDEGVPRGILAIAVAVLVGAGVGYLRVHQSGIDVAGRWGAALGAGLGLLVALVGIGLAHLADTTRPHRALFAGLAQPYLRAAVPFAAIAPIAFLIGTAMTG